MQEVLYYPSFEVQDEDWLKFALLYVDRLCPIIPQSGDKYLSHQFQRVIDSTDLIDPYRPEYDEGCKASEEAIQVVTRLLKYPQLLVEHFGDPQTVDRWRNPFNQRFLLFREKFAWDWLEFTRHENLGRETNHGIYMSRELASIYMTILAQKISDRLDIPPITDDQRADAFAVFTQKTTPVDPDSLTIGRTIVQMAVPERLSDIPVSQIIEFRNGKSFKARLHAFHHELQRHIDSVENGTATGNFFRTRGTALSDISDELASLGGRTVPVLVGIWLLLRAAEPALPDVAKQIAAATGATILSVISIRNYVRNSQERRFTRKFLADLRALPGDYVLPDKCLQLYGTTSMLDQRR